MDRRVIEIDHESCNGCGLCVNACEEGAIGLVNGKAYLLRDDYCDGLGNCLPACPKDAIHFIVREAAPFDEEAVAQHIARTRPQHRMQTGHHAAVRKDTPSTGTTHRSSKRKQWPLQLKLVPPKAPFLQNADIVLSADCAPFARDTFQEDFLGDKALLIACPKLDDADYSEMLAEIFSGNVIRSVTITRMEVPCCGGLEYAVSKALEKSGKEIPVEVVTITSQGEIKSTANS